jgi:pseudaminic acid synthase
MASSTYKTHTSLPDPFIVAEISGNHNGQKHKALKLIERAAKAGADAVKFQCYTPDTITLDCDAPDFIINEGPWVGARLYDLYQDAMTPWEWFEDLFLKAEEVGIQCFSSVFDKTAGDFLEELDCPIYKISSFEVTDLPLIKYAASKKPLIVSTGMASDDEIREVADAIHDVPLLHCVSAYPALPEGAGLGRLRFLTGLSSRVGLSDHSLSTVLPAVAVAMGASIIEKHFIISRNEGGPDAEFSMEPAEFAEMVANIRMTVQSMGEEVEKPYRGLRRSLYVSANISKGEKLTKRNIRSVRPGGGVAPKYIDHALGKCATKDLEFGKPLKEGDYA